MRRTLLFTNIFIIITVYLYFFNHTVFAEPPIFIDSQLESNLKEALCRELKKLSEQKEFINFCNTSIIYPFNKLLFYQQYFSDDLYIRKFVYSLPLIEIFENYQTKGAVYIQNYIEALFVEDVIKTRVQFESKLYFIPHAFFSFDLHTIKSNLDLASHIARSYIEIHPDATENTFVITKNEYAQYMKLKPVDTGIIYIAISFSGDSHEILTHLEFVYKYFDLLMPIKMKIPPIKLSIIPFVLISQKRIKFNLVILSNNRISDLLQKKLSYTDCFKIKPKFLKKNIHTFTTGDFKKQFPCPMVNLVDFDHISVKFNVDSMIRELNTLNKTYYEMRSYVTLGFNYCRISIIQGNHKNFCDLMRDILTCLQRVVKHNNLTKSYPIGKLYDSLNLIEQARTPKNEYLSFMHQIILCIIQPEYELTKPGIAIFLGKNNEFKKYYEIYLKTYIHDENTRQNLPIINKFPRDCVIEDSVHYETIKNTIKEFFPENVQEMLDNFKQIQNGIL